MKEPGGLLSIGLHRDRYDWSDLVCMRALEKEMATHSSILAWRSPGTGEPGGPPSMGSHRVGHDWSDLAAAAAACDSTVILWSRYYGFPIFQVSKPAQRGPGFEPRLLNHVPPLAQALMQLTVTRLLPLLNCELLRTDSVSSVIFTSSL